MKTNKLFITFAIVASTVCFASCDKDKDDPTPATGKELQIAATEWNIWHYFSFSEGKEIGTSDASKADEEATWKGRSNWDIAFCKSYARTNSGVSGNGKGGVVEMTAAKALADVTEAPASGYTVDVLVGAVISMPPSDPLPQVGSNEIINSWVAMEGMGYTVKPKVFVVKTADGKYAKVFLKSFQNDLGKNGNITMEYAYQPDGSTNLSSK